MDRRRTFLGESAPMPQPGSSIPVPSSAIKKQSILVSSNQPSSQSQSTSHNPNRQSMNPNRMSLAGGPPIRAQPQPQHGGAAPREGRRTTQLHSSGAQPAAAGGAYGGGFSQGAGASGGGGPSSGSRGDGGMYGRTPRGGGNASLRRSSTYGPRPSGITPSHGSTLPASQRDTRPIKDKNFQDGCRATIRDYLASAPRAPAMTPNYLSAPTSVDFQSLFRFLVTSGIDNDYVFGKGGKKFEEECLTLLRDMRYPAVEGISRTSLGAPGNAQWPNLLAMLAWMADLANLKRQWIDADTYEDYELLPAERIPFDAPNFDILVQREYIVSAYRQWVDGAEEFPEENEKLEEIYEGKFASIIEEGEALQIEVGNLASELRALQSAPSPLVTLDEEYRVINDDLVKYNNTVTHQEGKKEKATKSIQTLLETIEQLRAEAVTLRAEKQRIDIAVRQQGLSPEEVSRMNSDRETLARSFEDIRTKVLAAQKFGYDREMAVSKRVDSLDNLVTEYMGLAYRLGLLPSSTGEDFRIDLNLDGTTSSEILNGADVSGQIKRGLVVFAQGKREEHSRVVAETIRVDNELDRLLQVIEGLKDDGDILAGKVRGMTQDAEGAKQVAHDESAALLAQQQEVEGVIASTRGASRQKLIAAESKVESLKIEHGKLVHRTNQLREEIIADVIQHTEFIVNFKQLAGETLDGLKRYAEVN